MGTFRDNSSDIYEQGGGGGGTIVNGQNLGVGVGVFMGLSSSSTVMDFYSLTAVAGSGISISQVGSVIQFDANFIGDNLYVAESFPFGTGNTPNKTLINETYYGAVSPVGDGRCNTIYMWCEVLGGTPTAISPAIYNDAGTRLGYKATAVAPGSVGLFTITLDNFSAGSEVSFTGNNRYWVGLGGSNGSNSQWSGMDNATNSTSYNRYVTADPTPNTTLPAGTATAGRFWFRLAYV